MMLPNLLYCCRRHHRNLKTDTKKQDTCGQLEEEAEALRDMISVFGERRGVALIDEVRQRSIVILSERKIEFPSTKCQHSFDDGLLVIVTFPSFSRLLLSRLTGYFTR